jgi:chromosome segregation ATPase
VPGEKAMPEEKAVPEGKAVPGEKVVPEDKAVPEDNANHLEQLRQRRQVVDGHRDGIKDVLNQLRESIATLQQLLVDIVPEDAQNDEERERWEEIIGALELAESSVGDAISNCDDALGTADELD